MKSFKSHIGLWALSLVALTAGCGGQTETSQLLPRGEGSIPIGRAQTTYGCESAVKIVMSDGRVLNTVTRQQAVYAPVLPHGRTTVVVTPNSGALEQVEVTYYNGADQFWTFNARPEAKASVQTLKSISCNFVDGSKFEVGDTFPLEARVLGIKIGGDKPSVILSGGVARVGETDVMTFTKPGHGILILKSGSVYRSFSFTVEG